MVVVVSRTGLNQNVRWLLKGLYSEQLLQRFFTTLAVPVESPAVLKMLPTWKYRSCPIPGTLIDCSPGLELLRLLVSRLPVSFGLTNEPGPLSPYRVGTLLDKAVAGKLPSLPAKGCKVFYGYEDASLDSFKRARSLGMLNVYELTIAYWDLSSRLLHEEVERLPDWSCTISAPELLREKTERKTQELDLADLIICPSQFVVSSLPNSKAKCLLAPFGTPVLPELSVSERRRKLTGPLKVLFVGSMSQRKGLADLFEAVRLLNRSDIELIVVGKMNAPFDFYKKRGSFTYLQTRSNAELLELMRQCHVFCLPSIVEGRALVQQEAMASEMPLIITPNTGGEDLIIEGQTGFLVPIRSPQAIAERIAWCADNRAELIAMGIRARETASALTWDAYARLIADEIRQLAGSC